MKWWLPIVVPLGILLASVLFGHAWVLSDYLLAPGCCRELLPSRSTPPAYTKYTIGPYLHKQGLPHKTVTFNSLDDPANPARGATVAGWLVTAERSRGGVVLVHDSGADSRQLLPLVKLWVSYGYNCLMIQTQESGATRASLGLVAQYDVMAAVQHLKANSDSKALVVMGVGEGAAAALFAAQKSMQVDAVVGLNMHSESDELMLARSEALVADLQLLQQIPPEHAALKALHAAGLLFIDEDWVRPVVTQMASHMAVIRSSGWLTWLHGHTDPLKGVHRLQPRGLFLVQGKQDLGGTTIPIQKLYHRAGQCEPKLAHLPEERSDPATLSLDGKFKSGLGDFLSRL